MKGEFDLPTPWLWRSLGDVSLAIDYGLNTEATEEGTGRVFLRISDITDQGVLNPGPKKRLTTEVEGIDRFLLQEGDIVVARSGATFGRSFLTTSAEVGWIFASYLIRFRPDPSQVEPQYLAAVLRSELFRQYADRVGRSAAQPNINSKELARFRFPLPAISEQRLIAALFRQLDAVAQSSDDFNSRLRVICDNQFIELFGHPALNPKGFPVRPLAELGGVDRGVSKHRPRDAAHLYGGPYPFVQTGDVANAGDWITAYSSTYSQAGLLQSKLWPRGTLCITIAANIGDAAILDFDACFPDSIVGFTPDEGMTSEYVLYCIRSYQQYFKALAPQAAQKNINLETLRPLRLPIPPPDLQQKFHRFLLAVRVVSGAVAKRSTRIDDLRREFALASFRGELTETWRVKNAESIQQEVETRVRSGRPTVRTRVEFEEHLPAEREIQLNRPERAWLVDQLSDFQRRVRLTLLTEWRGTLIAGDLEALDDFSRLWPVEHDKDRRDQIRRALQQLAALGLIAKVSVRQTQDDGEVLFVDGFRPLRDEEVNPSQDYEALKALLRAEGNET